MPNPAWLPPILSVDGDWNETLQELYEVFCDSIKNGNLRYGSLLVWWDRTILPGDSYEEGFWHVIQATDRSDGYRKLDPRRAEKLTWLSPMIQNCSQAEVSCWVDAEGSKWPRTFLWLEEFDYMVVLEKRKVTFKGQKRDIMRLITAYCTDDPRTREKLKRRRDRCR
jgi:hypothetical protein